MILGPALADVVQQQRHIEHPPVDPARPGSTMTSGSSSISSPRSIWARVEMRLDGVLVDRVVVIDVELHHRHDRLELGDEGRQHAQARSSGAARVRGCRASASGRGRSASPRGPRASRRRSGRGWPRSARIASGWIRIAGAQRLFEEPQDVQLVLQECRRVGDGQPVRSIAVAGLAPSAAAQAARSASARACMAALRARSGRSASARRPGWRGGSSPA